ncbi:hypothetical protein NMY22_g20240 [Coprinellus aureogranulatus]|nr:hypothetical protein NMY22_g20240 [Coprinellus aureogranulatus]
MARMRYPLGIPLPEFLNLPISDRQAPTSPFAPRHLGGNTHSAPITMPQPKRTRVPTPPPTQANFLLAFWPVEVELARSARLIVASR